MVRKFVTATSRWFNVVGLAITLPCMVGVITVDVFGRKFLNRPLAGANEIVGFGLAIMTYASISYCWSVGGHIRLDLLLSRMRPRLRQVCEALAAGVWLIFFSLLLFWQSYFVVPDSFIHVDIGTDSKLPLWPIKGFIALGALLFCLQLLVSFFTSVAKFIKNDR